MLLLTSLALQLAPAVAPSTARPGDHHDRLHFVEADDSTWVRGRTYKAGFDATGFTYVPFLGAEAPRNFPLALQLGSARIGGVELELTETAEVVRDGSRIVLDRGPVDVVYDLALEGVEQSFVLDARGYEGDLVLEIATETELLPESFGAGFRFFGPSGGVDYGEAFALDGHGARESISTVLGDDGSLRLTVPASFLAGLDGPVLVDPIVSTYTVDQFSAPLSNVDVAFQVEGLQNVYVYQEQFSGQDTDVYCRALDTFTSVVVAGGYFDLDPTSVTSPKIAQVQIAGAGPSGNSISRCLAVGVRTYPGGSNAIVGRIFHGTTGTFGPEFVIETGTATTPLSDPDVGGSSDRLDPDPRFIVAFTRTRLGAGGNVESGVRIVDKDGSVVSSQDFSVGSGVVLDKLVVSKGTGGNQDIDEWNFAFRHRFNSAFPWQLFIGQFDADGNLVAGPYPIRIYNGLERPEELDVSESLIDGAAPATFLVSATLTNTSQLNRKELLQCSGGQLIQTHSLTELEHGSFLREAGPVRVATTWSYPSRPMFLAVYQEEEAFGEYGVYYTALNQPRSGELAIVERRVRVGSGAAPSAGGPAVATRSSSGFESRFALIGWTEWVDSATPTPIRGATTELSAAAAIGQQYCYGEPNSTGDRGFLTITGASDVASMKSLYASALPPGVFGFFIVGQGAGSVPAAGGGAGTLCLGGAGIGRALDQVLTVAANGLASRTLDPAQLPTPTGFAAAAAGQTWRFQFWHRDLAATGPTANFTNAVALRFD